MTTALKNLKVLNDYIIIKPSQQPDEDVTESGLIVSKNPGDPSLIFHYAKVVGVGDLIDEYRSEYESKTLDISVGDVVYYAQKKASALAIVEDDYIYDPRKANYAYIKPEDVIAVVTNDEAEVPPHAHIL
jgi:co-chaperonin GroES (HSP10)